MIGALSGAIILRRGTYRGQAQASQQIDQQSRQATQLTQEQLDNFKKAFSVCLEAKDYLAKY